MRVFRKKKKLTFLATQTHVDSTYITIAQHPYPIIDHCKSFTVSRFTMRFACDNLSALCDMLKDKSLTVEIQKVFSLDEFQTALITSGSHVR